MNRDGLPVGAGELDLSAITQRQAVARNKANALGADVAREQGPGAGAGGVAEELEIRLHAVTHSRAIAAVFGGTAGFKRREDQVHFGRPLIGNLAVLLVFGQLGQHRDTSTKISAAPAGHACETYDMDSRSCKFVMKFV